MFSVISRIPGIILVFPWCCKLVVDGLGQVPVVRGGDREAKRYSASDKYFTWSILFLYVIYFTCCNVVICVFINVCPACNRGTWCSRAEPREMLLPGFIVKKLENIYISKYLICSRVTLLKATSSYKVAWWFLQMTSSPWDPRLRLPTRGVQESIEPAARAPLNPVSVSPLAFNGARVVSLVDNCSQTCVKPPGSI